MVSRYIGNLSVCDPLYDYLRDEILPQLQAPDGPWTSCPRYQPAFRVYRLAGSHEVYLYAEEYSNIHLIGKFFGGHASGEITPSGATYEFFRMQQLRECGFADYIPRPLGCSTALNDVLIEEYCEGATLTRLLSDAVSAGHGACLLHALSALGLFLAALHSRMMSGGPITFQEDCDYQDKVVSQLVTGHHLSIADASEFAWLRERWREQWSMWTDRQVLVHGDATPGNFLFRDATHMTAIDLERTRCADRVLDLGRVAGEIKYFFLRANRDKYSADPFIGHFLRAYVDALPGDDAAFCSITNRLPFHMGTTFLRIARNSWVSMEERQMLIAEARHTLHDYTLKA